MNYRNIEPCGAGKSDLMDPYFGPDCFVFFRVIFNTNLIYTNVFIAGAIFSTPTFGTSDSKVGRYKKAFFRSWDTPRGKQDRRISEMCTAQPMAFAVEFGFQARNSLDR